jgi:hypothetical protein
MDYTYGPITVGPFPDYTPMVNSELLYSVCDAEFTSRIDIHESFENSVNAKSWARFHLVHEIRKIAIRDGIYLSTDNMLMVAMRIAADWYTP